MPHFTKHLGEADPLVAGALADESRRQRDQIELIASENIVSRAVLDALSHEITNKTLEGYPGARFHGGGINLDVAEQAAIDRACALFGCAYANVQPHSGSQANLAVFFLLLSPGDRVLSLDLAAGGHLSHGLRANLSGRWFEAHHYGVDPTSEMIDYDQVAARADEVRPKLMIAGGSAYPRRLDFARLGQIAHDVGAHFLVDMAHIAGLVAARAHPSPFPHADIVTCTTTKTLRGPRGGIILSNDPEHARRLQAAVFPGVQGSLHSQVIAAKAVCLGEALAPEFRAYGARVVANARLLARVLAEHGLRIVTGGTDTHLVLVDVGSIGLTGARAQAVLERANITTNKNPIPGDAKRPADWVGLRLGTAAATTRGLGEAEFSRLGNAIGALLAAEATGETRQAVAAAHREVADLTRQFPIYR